MAELLKNGYTKETWNGDTILVVSNYYHLWEDDSNHPGRGYYFINNENDVTFGEFNINSWSIRYTEELGAAVLVETGTRPATKLTEVQLVDTKLAYTCELLETNVTQTLFNTDDKFEYIRCRYAVTENTLREEKDGNYLYYEALPSALEIVQDDGNVIASISLKEYKMTYAPYVKIIKNEDSIYLVVTNHNNAIIFLWNPSTSSISKVKEMNNMRVYPNPARRTENVSIVIPENVKEGRLVVTSANGDVLETLPLNGEQNMQVSTARMTSGIYMVTLYDRGKIVETTKIIVR